MGRKKRAYLSDDDSSEASEGDDEGYEEQNPFGNIDADESAERTLFEDPYQLRQRKRRRLNRKDDATYGIFGEDDDDGPVYAKEKVGRKKARTPTFQRASTSTVQPIQKNEIEEDESESESSGDSNSSSEEESNKPGRTTTQTQASEEEESEEEETPMQLDQEEEQNEEERPRVGLGGIGSRGGIGSSSRGGIGSSSAGTNSTRAPPSFAPRQGLGAGNTARPPMFTSAKTLDPSSLTEAHERDNTNAHPTPSNRDTDDVMNPVPSSAAATPPPRTPTPSAQPTPSAAMSQMATNLPTAFGATRTQRAFVRNESLRPDSSTPAPVQLSYEERAHFVGLSSSYGAKLMEKMGWRAGTGLGASAQGIVTPVESKLRPKGNIGIAYGGFKERTKQAIAEDRRKGKIVGSDDEDKPRRKGGKGKVPHGEAEKVDRSDMWKKKSKSKKVVVEHKTYEEIVQEAGLDTSAHQAGIGPIIDATGATPRELSSLSQITSTGASWTPSTDSTRIPEIRHNLRLLVEMTQRDLQGLAREGKLVAEKKRQGKDEERRIIARFKEEAELIRRLEGVRIVCDELTKESRDLQRSRVSASEEHLNGKASSPLQTLTPYINRLLSDFSVEYDRYRLDELVVGATAPYLRAGFAHWNPLEEPAKWTNILKEWKQALKMSTREKISNELGTFYGFSHEVKPEIEDVKVMTPYEAFLWHAWLPKIRSAINNDWDPTDAAPAVALYEAWYDLIPPFLQDNILDQLIIPKVQRAVAAWKPSHSTVGGGLRGIVFPWLPHVGLRMEEYLSDARRKVRSIFKAADISRGVPEELLAWKQMFDASQWEELVLKYIVPKLGVTLREDFRINPRNQNMEPLLWVLEWFEQKVIRGSIMSQLLEMEFFPKWMDVLHLWLTQPKASYEEIAQWYSFWKGAFPSSVLALAAAQEGFKRGLELMDEAMNLDDSARIHMPKPTPFSTSTSTSASAKHQQQAVKKPPPSRLTEVTFKGIAEEYAAEHNLLFMPTGRVHEKSRIPMHRVTGRTDGKGGIVVYILDDVVWAVDGGTPDGAVTAVTFEEMVLQASKMR